MDIVERLKAAKAKIESVWTKHEYAVRADGYKANNERDPKAVAWCAMGAMHAVAPDGFESITFRHPLLLAARENSGMGISEFNDRESTTQKDVLDLYDRAIAIAQGAP